MPLVLHLILFAISALAADCPSPGSLADDATEAYLRLLRRLVVEKRLVPAEVATRIADADTAINPLETEREGLTPIQAHVFREAFAHRLHEGVDWARVRHGSRAIAAAEGVVSQSRATAKDATVSLPGIGVVIPDLLGPRGLPKMRDLGAVRTRTARDGVSYIVEVGERNTSYALRIDGDAIKGFPLPRGTKRAELVEGKSGAMYAVCASESATRLINLADGSIVREIWETPGNNDIFFIREQQLAILSGDGLRFFPFDGGAPVTHKLAPGMKHVPSQNGERIFSHGFVDGKLVVVDGETGKLRFATDIPRPETSSIYDTAIRLSEDDAGQPVVVARGPHGKTILLDENGLRRRELDAGVPLVSHSTFMKGRGDELIWVIATRDPSAPGHTLFAFGPHSPTPHRLPMPANNVVPHYKIRAADGRPLVVMEEKSIDPSDNKLHLRLIVYDAQNGERHVLEIDATRFYSLQGVTHGKDGAVMALVAANGLTSRSLIQIYGPLRAR